ncbi:related to B2-aldehyde-forming enzyme [Melanopsichium pennsylvanicum]|uniref:Related to B2-aldehyde-forming enzyme n=2 Tax=Melanopsichium pennsylvanicum TaxID=63383 RepID=A0AAJ5C2V9_9BASI|nr:related to B2-aldehyde-forming enzyme [Melanopsichium pennsylvanicum 4]SNX81917.1 related to B2-aldehyde-forming enzyme [Melanopsichium pennsylvanicum]
MPSLATKVCTALLIASGLIGTTLAEDQHHQQVKYVRSLKHSRRGAAASHHGDLSEAGPSTLAKRGPTYSGRATYYAAGLGACGNYNSGSDFIVALNAAQYGNMGQRSSWCGKTIAITYNGNTQYATVQDACPSCPYGGLDMSEGLFKAFASTDLGVFYMSWTAADGSGGDNNDNNSSSNNNKQTSTSSTSTSTWTPKPTPTTTWQAPTTTWTPTSTSSSSSSTSHSFSSSSTSSSATPTWSSTSSSASPTSTSSSSSSSTSSSSAASTSSASTTVGEATNNLDSFALIYQGLNQMAVAAAS